MPLPNQNKQSARGPSVAAMVEDVVGCKWTLRVLGSIRRGLHRPGGIRAAIPGLTTKVLNERLRKLASFGVVSRTAFAEIPPRVEYRLTPLGRRFVRILDQIERLERDVGGAPPRSSVPQATPRRGSRR